MAGHDQPIRTMPRSDANNRGGMPLVFASFFGNSGKNRLRGGVTHQLSCAAAQRRNLTPANSAAASALVRRTVDYYLLHLSDIQLQRLKRECRASRPSADENVTTIHVR